MTKPDPSLPVRLVQPEPPPPFTSLEDTERLALETAHKNIVYLSRVPFLTLDEVRALGELARIVKSCKDTEMKEYALKRKVGR